MRVIAIGGIPGTGKTTLIRSFMNNNEYEFKELRKLVNGMVSDNHIILGDYSDKDAVFAGLDKASMAIQPEAETFFDEVDKNVIFEGDRIFNSKMLEFINQKHELLTLIIETDDDLVKKRYEQRGSDQSEKFISGRKTKYDNIKKNPNLTVYIHQHDTEEDTKLIIYAMKMFLQTGKILFEKVEFDNLDSFFS